MVQLGPRILILKKWLPISMYHVFHCAATVLLDFEQRVYFADELGPVQVCVVTVGEPVERGVELDLLSTSGSADSKLSEGLRTKVGRP